MTEQDEEAIAYKEILRQQMELQDDVNNLQTAGLEQVRKELENKNYQE